MDKVELTKAVKLRAGVTFSEAKPIVDLVFQVMAETMRRGERVRIGDFCTFDVMTDPPRQVRNPQTGEMMTVPSKRVAKIRLSAYLKRMLAQEDVS